MTKKDRSQPRSLKVVKSGQAPTKKARTKKNAKDSAAESEQSPTQQDLPGVEAPKAPETIINGMYLVKFVKPHHNLEVKKKKELREIGLEISFALKKAHHQHVPKKVKAAWDWLEKSENKSVNVLGIPALTIELAYSPDMEPEIVIPFAEIRSAAVVMVEESGSGQDTEVLRYSFRAWAELTKELLNFCGWNHGKDMWMKAVKTQKEIEDVVEEDKEEAAAGE